MMWIIYYIFSPDHLSNLLVLKTNFDKFKTNKQNYPQSFFSPVDVDVMFCNSFVMPDLFHIVVSESHVTGPLSSVTCPLACDLLDGILKLHNLNLSNDAYFHLINVLNMILDCWPSSKEHVAL